MDNSGKLLGAQINREWFLYQEKEVFAEYRQKRLTIGLPNETERRENRVCLTPEAVAMMVDMGHTIMVQRGAGEAAHYHDREYADAGAQMLDTDVYKRQLQDIEDDEEIFESIEDIWPDYPSKDDFFFNEDEY